MQHVLLLVEQMYANATTPEVESKMNDVINIVTQEGLPMEQRQLDLKYGEGYHEGIYDALNK